MLFNLAPSEDITGGSWHQEGEYDLSMIDTVSKFVFIFIQSKSWVEDPRKPNRADIKKKKEAVQLAKQQPSQVVPIEDCVPDPPRFKPMLSNNGRPLIPRAPDFKGYPTYQDVLEFVNNGAFLMKTLTEVDIILLLENMIYDGKLERMGIDGFRTARGASGPGEEYEPPENGFTDAPCGRCPVFNLCEEGGPVNAANCIYFEDWLNMDRE